MHRFRQAANGDGIKKKPDETQDEVQGRGRRAPERSGQKADEHGARPWDESAEEGRDSHSGIESEIHELVGNDVVKDQAQNGAGEAGGRSERQSHWPARRMDRDESPRERAASPKASVARAASRPSALFRKSWRSTVNRPPPAPGAGCSGVRIILPQAQCRPMSPESPRRARPLRDVGWRSRAPPGGGFDQAGRGRSCSTKGSVAETRGILYKYY